MGRPAGRHLGKPAGRLGGWAGWAERWRGGAIFRGRLLNARNARNANPEASQKQKTNKERK